MSYNPALERCVYLIKNEIEASRRFYLYVDKMLSLHDTIKFMMAILVNLKKQAQHQLQNFSEEMGDNEEDDKENQKVPFIYYLSTFLVFLDPLPPHVGRHVFSTENKQNLSFSNPTLPYKCLRNIWMVPKGLGDSNIVNQNESTVLKDGSIRLANDTLQVRIFYYFLLWPIGTGVHLGMYRK